jgi:hypothetical protein
MSIHKFPYFFGSKPALSPTASQPVPGNLDLEKIAYN